MIKAGDKDKHQYLSTFAVKSQRRECIVARGQVGQMGIFPLVDYNRVVLSDPDLLDSSKKPGHKAQVEWEAHE
jgi:hypothetical protein